MSEETEKETQNGHIESVESKEQKRLLWSSGAS